jgi:inorganic pyrophosphatase
MLRQGLFLALSLATLPATMAAGQIPAEPPTVLPAEATAALAASLKASSGLRTHSWRDPPPFNADGTVNAFIEIGRGDRRKWELDMATNRRAVDRTIPVDVGGYPVNYGFVPQTVSYDGDPFDALVLGPALDGGRLVRGAIVGVMHMEDEKGLDSKVVLSRLGPDGRPLHTLTPDVQKEIGEYFERYKRHESGKFSKVPGWGSAETGRRFVETTHAFFQSCGQHADTPCSLGKKVQ